MKMLGVTIGVAWIAYAADLLVRETASVVSGPLQFSSYIAVLVQAVLLILAGTLLIFSLGGRTVVSALVALYVGFGHFIFLSNTWYEANFETWFAIAVVGLTLLTFIYAVLTWVGIGRSSPEGISRPAQRAKSQTS